MPHAALLVVQLRPKIPVHEVVHCFNAARGFVGGAASNVYTLRTRGTGFNAARGVVGGAAMISIRHSTGIESFNAARGVVGGAA